MIVLKLRCGQDEGRNNSSRCVGEGPHSSRSSRGRTSAVELTGLEQVYLTQLALSYRRFLLANTSLVMSFPDPASHVPGTVNAAGGQCIDYIQLHSRSSSTLTTGHMVVD